VAERKRRITSIGNANEGGGIIIEDGITRRRMTECMAADADIAAGA